MLLSSFVYTFNAQRQKIGSQEYVLNSDGTFINTTITWQYEADGRLTDEDYSDGVSADSYHDHYDYDAAGNRVDEQIAPANSTSYTSNNAYQYNADGQLTGEADNYPTNHPEPTVRSPYDANG